MLKETNRFSRELLTQFYSRHQGLPWFDDFIQFMISDVCELIILAREDAGLTRISRENKRTIRLIYFSFVCCSPSIERNHGTR